jgi:hypothetical protein
MNQNSQDSGSTPFEEEDEPEPLSVAPNRLKQIADLKQAADSKRCLDSKRGSEKNDLEVVSMRVRLAPVPTESTPFGNVISEGVRHAILETAHHLLQRARRAEDPLEQERFTVYADSLEKLLIHPIARQYLGQYEIARDLSTYLARFQESLRESGDHPEYQGVILKARLSAIHLAPCLGYWRSNPSVPPRVQALLTPENVYSSALEIAKTRKSRALDRLIAHYTSTVGALQSELERTRKTAIKVRNPILWPWCKYNIKNVAYSFQRGKAGGDPRRPPDGGGTEGSLEDTIADVKLMLVVFNVLLDDVADNLQDARILEILSGIPTVGGELGVAPSRGYDRLKGRLREIDERRFEPYFDLAVETWRVALTTLEELTGAAFQELKPQLAHDYDRILRAMRFSVDLNSNPGKMFNLDADVLEREYGGGRFGEIFGHNANRVAFFTIDLMRLRHADPERYADIVRSGSIHVYRESAMLFQEMHQMGNSVATGAREAWSDDMSNELFKIANDLLNEEVRQLPPSLSKFEGTPKEDELMTSFNQRREAKRKLRELTPGTPAHDAKLREYQRLGDRIDLLFESSAAEMHYFQQWLAARDKVADIFAGAGDCADQDDLLYNNDLILVLHLMYKGKI